MPWDIHTPCYMAVIILVADIGLEQTLTQSVLQVAWKQKQQQIEQHIFLIRTNAQINHIGKSHHALQQILKEIVLLAGRKPRFNRQTFAATAHKTHNITGAVTGIIALQNDLLFLNIRGIVDSFRENKNAFLFQFAQGFIGDFVHKALDRSKVAFGQCAIILNFEQLHLLPLGCFHRTRMPVQSGS